jgi:hypothetical protein
VPGASPLPPFLSAVPLASSKKGPPPADAEKCPCRLLVGSIGSSCQQYDDGEGAERGSCVVAGAAGAHWLCPAATRFTSLRRIKNKNFFIVKNGQIPLMLKAVHFDCSERCTTGLGYEISFSTSSTAALSLSPLVSRDHVRASRYSKHVSQPQNMMSTWSEQTIGEKH